MKTRTSSLHALACLKPSLLLILSILSCSFLFAYSPPLCTNILENPGFEDDLNGWTLTGEGGITTDALSGNNGANICGDGYGTLGQISSTSPGMEYKATIKGKVEGEPGGMFTVRFLDVNYSPIQVTGQPLSINSIESSSYFEEEVYGIAPVGAVYVHLLFWKEYAGCFIVDDLELCEDVPTPETYVRIGCPYDILVNAEPGTSGAVVEYTGTTAANVSACLPSSGFVQTAGLPTNSFFPIGTTLNCFSYTNNCGDTDECCFNVIVNGLLPDLIITEAIVPNPIMVSASTVDVTLTVQNIGQGVFKDSYVEARVSINGNQVSSVGTSTYPDSITLAPGESITFTDDVNLAWFPGALFIDFEVDLFQYVAESNDSNNSITVETELVEDGLTTDLIFGNMEALQVTSNGNVVIENNDEVEAGNVLSIFGHSAFFTYPDPEEAFTFLREVRISEDEIFDANDLLLSSEVWNITTPYPLGTQGTQLLSEGGLGQITLPDNMSPGQYYIIGKYDALNEVSESDESNNTAIIPINIINPNTFDGVDLSLSLAQENDNPSQWGYYTVLATITNEGNEMATGIEIDFSKPDGVVYAGGSEYVLSQGYFDLYGSETWSVGPLDPGATATIEVNYFLLLPEAPVAYAQVIAMNEDDVDSTPNNGTPPVPNEDDEASTSDDPVELKPDLELEMEVRAPWTGPFTSNFEVDVIIQNNGTVTATNVDAQVGELIGAVFNSFNPIISQGTYDEITGEWMIGSVNPDQQVTLTLFCSRSSSNLPFSLFAEISNQNEMDVDSSPGNGNGTDPQEDDEALVPGRPCNISVEIVDYNCIPATQGSNQLDKFYYDILVENAPDGWTVRFGLYTPGNSTGNGDGLFTIGPIERYAVEVGMEIYDYGYPLCTDSAPYPIPSDCDLSVLPDLTILNYTLSANSANPGTFLNYEFDLANIGGGNADDDFNVRAYISEDNLWSAFNDLLVDDIPTANFDAGYTAFDVQGAAGIPDDLEEGDYYLFVVADAFNDFNEGSESNNIISLPITIGNGSGSPCDDVNVEVGTGSITISNTNAPHVLKKIFNPDWSTALDCLDATCDDPSIVTGLATGTYNVQVKLMDANWNVICDYDEYHTIVESLNGSVPSFSQGRVLENKPLELKSIQPNPSISGNVSIVFLASETKEYELQCYNSLGKIEASYPMYLEEGISVIPLDVSNLTAGTYFVHVPGEALKGMGRSFVVVRD